ncbi:hypothetical protein PT974_03210 [Cladobotryum mycophilum]|uniref:N-acetyltransferase domain-containing protein n=1 Tax=Cladobotryum mycophilum TaxID=491253 RepID=A0ABR0SRM9_9HYPO
MSSPFQVFQIDQDSPNHDQLAAKYRELRLNALKQSPTSFASTFEVEEKYSIEYWSSKLFHPNKKTFICIDKGSSATAALEESQWVAQVTLLGPIPADSFRLPEESGQPPVLSDEEEERWQMLGLFSLPSHRGKGLAKLICRTAYDYLTSFEQGAPKVVLRIMVKPENTVTLNMYSSMGFADAGKCTLEEALRANGETDHIPENPSEKFKTRSGIIMQLPLQRQR